MTGLAEWHTPTAGMFLWIRVHVLDDVRHLVMEECIRRGVMFVTGHAYIVTPNTPCQYLRASYSLPTLQEIDEGVARLADAIRTERRKRKALKPTRESEAPNKRTEVFLADSDYSKNVMEITAAIQVKHLSGFSSAKLLRGSSDGILVKSLRGLNGPLGT